MIKALRLTSLVKNKGERYLATKSNIKIKEMEDK